MAGTRSCHFLQDGVRPIAGAALYQMMDSDPKRTLYAPDPIPHSAENGVTIHVKGGRFAETLAQQLARASLHLLNEELKTGATLGK